ncbi:NAD(P)-dependent dehydrogenase (short-subunit alcohol dehydrogenase family) [Actinocorallia herbida]|uniref:NAD(P)-dependent dehydrogenase (Short-subunit alcohol dehydrogenase family) n=1 Tax=Actinocorallia herbida TaxID=58109 RepID=A0A3N1CX45_9ACTN|nr:SDR family NAD(P)-dependent oxidoreductase [Actinocorallia herbida]ROO85805.1 NAD(P)-dependent dehydrogenase (short-subunit alcohol dehydrogenase family) [Actinocorallia herbida]
MNEIDFTGRVAVVTGAGGGIGRAHALLLAARGASVVVADVGGAEEVVAEIEKAGGSAVAATASIATAEGGASVVAAALAAFGRLDVVLHNAGILRDASFAKMAEADVADVMAVHLDGAFHVLRPAWPVMRAQNYGRVLLTTSASGLFGTFGQANYAAAKAGLVGLMNVLAVEGARHGIQVNALSPTAATRMTEGLLGDLADRFDPAHIAPVAAYLVSERCALTHHILSAGGGRVARIFVGTTPGAYLGADPATPEAVEAALDEVLDLDSYVVPEDGTGEVALIRRALLGEA